MIHYPPTVSAVEFEAQIKKAQSELIHHPLFKVINDINQMKLFMEYHVFAVWDFMSLLKTLQKQLTSIQVPWLPAPDPSISRFINEIVLGEESDEVSPHCYLSHFELYCQAMRECGASTRGIDSFISLLKAGMALSPALDKAQVILPVKNFVLCTLQFCQLAPHQVASAFFFGREDVIPQMFQQILQQAQVLHTPSMKKLKLYLERHIDLDGNSHGPLAAYLINQLCGQDNNKWQEAIEVGLQAIKARKSFWDGILITCSQQSLKNTPVSGLWVESVIE